MQLINEHGTHIAQTIDDMTVVNDFMAHVYGCTEEGNGPLDDIDRAIDPGTEAARIGELDLHRLRRQSAKASHSSRIAPIVIAESAMLKAGKYACCQCTWMKSTT